MNGVEAPLKPRRPSEKIARPLGVDPRKGLTRERYTDRRVHPDAGRGPTRSELAWGDEAASPLADGFGRANAWVTRVGVGVFLVFFSAYDAVAGIATGLAMRSARDLSAVQQDGVFEVVRDWPAAGPPFALSIVGTLGWVAAAGALALATRRQHAPRSESILVGLAALFLLGGHPFPQGTLAFGCFFIAALLHELRASP